MTARPAAATTMGAEPVQAPLTGRIFDSTGERMSPTFAVGARCKRYRYYVSTSLQKGRRGTGDCILRRVPAGRVEQAVAERMRRIDGVDAAAPFTILLRIGVHADRIILDLPAALRRTLQASLEPDQEITEDPRESDRLRLTLPFSIPRRGGRPAVAPGAQQGPQPDPVLIRALRTAHGMQERDDAGRPILAASPTSPYRRRLLRLAFLAPQLQAAILSGRQPADLTLSQLLAVEIPPCWDEQMRRFGPVAG